MLAVIVALVFVVVAFGFLAQAHHVFKCADVLNADTRSLFKRMSESGQLPPRGPTHAIPPPAPSPVVVVDMAPVHNDHGPCEACGSKFCREAGTRPGPTSTKGLPVLPGSDEGPPSEAPTRTKTWVGLSPIPFVTRNGTMERGG